MTGILIAFTAGFALWIAATGYAGMVGLVLLKDRRLVPGALLVLLAVAMLFGGCTYLYQLGEVPS